MGLIKNIIKNWLKDNWYLLLAAFIVVGVIYFLLFKAAGM